MISKLLFASVLLVLSAVLTFGALAPAGEDWPQSEEAKSYLKKRRRRRLLSSGLLALVSLAIGGGAFLPPLPWTLFYWFAVFLAVICLLMVGLRDAQQTRQFYHQQHQQLHQEFRGSFRESEEGNS